MPLLSEHLAQGALQLKPGITNDKRRSGDERLTAYNLPFLFRRTSGSRGDTRKLGVLRGTPFLITPYRYFL